MEHKIENLQAGLLVGFTCFLAVALCVNAVQALAGKATFAYWHIITLFGCTSLVRSAVSWVTLARWALSLKNLRKRAVNLRKQAFTIMSGAVRSLTAPLLRNKHAIRL